ncbi:hypothetical protein OBV_31440 [Oscillibacter valericigenes Sjm18-20]|nr:hypothetical protein OBV_31440 [Oscillibacter valericigenes Sjm18-20]
MINFIIRRSKLIERIFFISFILCSLSTTLVGVNYDLTKYLPESTESSKALSILKEDFTYPGTGRVMLKRVSLYEAKALKDRIESVDGVDMVMWCDTKTNIYGADTFISYSKIRDYYKDGNAYMDVTFTDSDSSSSTHKAVNEVKQIIGDKGVIAGSAAADAMLGPTVDAATARVMVLAVIFIFLLLTLTTTSWFEPVLFMAVMFIAIVLGMGTNLLFGEVSFMSNAVGATLQLACSIDYSIFLLHAFTREKAAGAPPEQAMANALRSAVSSIGASGATTIVGFLALALMRFKIGRDMGLVLAKGIAFSLVTVLLLMPALILRFQKIIEKTSHRSFMPGFRKFGEFDYKIRIPVLIIILFLVIPCYVAQGMSDFTYGNDSIANTPGTEIYENEQAIDKEFGQSNMMLALVPIGDNKAEKKLTEELDGLPYSKYAMSLSSILPDGIPEEIVPRSLVKKLHSKHWARIIVNVRSPGESKEAFGYANKIRSIIKKYYPNQTTYLTGLTPSTQDIKQVITKDYSFVNILSLLGVSLVIAITYKSLVLPFIVLIPIEAAVFINTAIPYVMGNRTMFLGFIIVSCVQLGATVDYSILLTGNYLDARIRSNKKEAAILAVTQSALPIMTSGLILTTVGYGQYFLTSIAAIASLGELIGRGAFISTLLVLFLLPACLMMFDCLIMKGKRLSYIHDIKSKPPRISICWARHLMSQLPKQHHGGHLHDWGDRFRNCRKPSHLFSAHCSKEEEHNDKRTR